MKRILVVLLWWKTCYACNKTKDGYKLNGVKTFTSMSKALTHYIVAAFVEDIQEAGF